MRSRYYGVLFGVARTATDEGKLSLRIVPSPYNTEVSGLYDVRVSAGR